jgi:hypothetical protein
MNLKKKIPLLWVSFALLDPDPNPQPYFLAAHLMRHTGERRDRFSCALCGKAFASRSRLKLHEDSHIITELQVIIGIFHA